MYLVTGTVVKRRYISEKETELRVTKRVVASSEGEAEVKFHCYYERMSCEYDVYYSVYNVEVVETIDFELTDEEKEKYSYKLN